MKGIEWPWQWEEWGWGISSYRGVSLYTSSLLSHVTPTWFLCLNCVIFYLYLFININRSPDCDVQLIVTKRPGIYVNGRPTFLGSTVDRYTRSLQLVLSSDGFTLTHWFTQFTNVWNIYNKPVVCREKDKILKTIPLVCLLWPTRLSKVSGQSLKPNQVSFKPKLHIFLNTTKGSYIKKSLCFSIPQLFSISFSW